MLKALKHLFISQDIYKKVLHWSHIISISIVYNAFEFSQHSFHNIKAPLTFIIFNVISSGVIKSLNTLETLNCGIKY